MGSKEYISFITMVSDAVGISLRRVYQIYELNVIILTSGVNHSLRSDVHAMSWPSYQLLLSLFTFHWVFMGCSHLSDYVCVADV